MTSREFIQRNFGVPSEKERSCSSIFADKRGNIYSYGHHYPLLFKIGKLTFVNHAGYSNTTAKHIGWAHQAADSLVVLVVKVWLSGCDQYSWDNRENRGKVPALLYANLYHDAGKPWMTKMLMEAVVTDLRAELVDINERISTKTRTDTKIYQSLLAERWDCVDRLDCVRAELEAMR